MPSLNTPDDDSSSSTSSFNVGSAFYGHLAQIKNSGVSSSSKTVSSSTTASSSSTSEKERKRIVRIDEKLNQSFENEHMTREQCYDNWYTQADYRRFRLVREIRGMGNFFVKPWKNANSQQS
jgi:hypothetical protein